MAEYVDASSHNGTPNLAAYWAAGHRHLMLKATEGTDYFWDGMPALARQWHSFGPSAQVGYYHWLYGTETGAAQHAWFWSHIAPVWRSGDWMMTDFEDVTPSRWVSDAEHAQVVGEFDGLCQQHGPVHDYAPNWYIANMPICRAYFKLRKIVASDYSHTPPLNPYGLDLVAHQYTDRAAVPGFPSPVDYNRWLTTDPFGTSPTQEGPFMTLPQPALDAMAHQVGVTDANVKAIYTWTQSVLMRVAALGATVQTQAATLTALQAAMTALQSAPPGTVDLQPVLDAVDKLPEQTRALFTTQPLKLS